MKKNKKKQLKSKADILASRIPACRENLSQESQRSYMIIDYYEDRLCKCVDCGEEFVFTAETQKVWYEERKKNINMKPIRCEKHYRLWLDDEENEIERHRICEAYKKSPESPKAIEDYILSVVKWHKINGQGNLEKVIELSKKVGGNEEVLAYCHGQIKKQQKNVEDKNKFKQRIREKFLELAKNNFNDIDELYSVLYDYFDEGCVRETEYRKMVNFLFRGENSIAEVLNMNEETKSYIKYFANEAEKQIRKSGWGVNDWHRFWPDVKGYLKEDLG